MWGRAWVLLELLKGSPGKAHQCLPSALFILFSYREQPSSSRTARGQGSTESPQLRDHGSPQLSQWGHLLGRAFPEIDNDWALEDRVRGAERTQGVLWP